MRALFHAALLCAATAAVAQAPPTTSAQLGWLAGCWNHAPGEHGSGEQWTAPAGGVLFGVTRTMRRGQTVSHEFLQIRDTPRGLVLIALPSSQREATFELQEAGERRVAFHNPTHDFPQRVIYEASDADTLEGRIEGLRNGQSRTVRFPMKRAPCPLGATP